MARHDDSCMIRGGNRICESEVDAARVQWMLQHAAAPSCVDTMVADAHVLRVWTWEDAVPQATFRDTMHY